MPLRQQRSSSAHPTTTLVTKSRQEGASTSQATAGQLGEAGEGRREGGESGREGHRLLWKAIRWVFPRGWVYRAAGASCKMQAPAPPRPAPPRPAPPRPSQLPLSNLPQKNGVG